MKIQKPINHQMHIKNLLLLAALITAIPPSQAVESNASTPAEIAMCKARIYSRLGPRDNNTMHMHHYCSGLKMLDRAYAATKNKSDLRYKAHRAISHFDYVIQHTEEKFSWRGEVHLNKARALNLIGKKADAINEIMKALNYNATSSEAYQNLADHFKETGNKAKALEFVIEGLKRSPEATGLKRRYTELGGKLPYPTPNEPQQPALNPSTPSEVITAAAKPSIESNSEKQNPEMEKQKPIQPNSGNSKNPYCRFCPD